MAVVVSTISDVIMLAANYSNAIDYIDPLDSESSVVMFWGCGLSYLLSSLLSLDGFEHIWMFSSVYPYHNSPSYPFSIIIPTFNMSQSVRDAQKILL